MSIDHSFHLDCADVDGHEVPSAGSLFSDVDSVEVNSMYELNHIHLPSRTPAHLRSIRIAMVINSEKLNCSHN